MRHVVVGLGCNVGWVDFPPELVATATSCEREAGRAVDRAALLDAFLTGLAGRLDALGDVPAAYRTALSTLGRAVRVELASRTVEGIATDVDGSGRLVVAPPDADPVVVAVGDVVHLRPLTGRGSPPPAR